MSDYIHSTPSKSCHCLLFLHLMQSLKNMDILKCTDISLKPAQNFLPNKGHTVWKEKPWQVFLICFDVSVSTQLIHKERAHIAHVSNLHSKHLPQKEVPQNCFGSSNLKILYLVIFKKLYKNTGQ